MTKSTELAAVQKTPPAIAAGDRGLTLADLDTMWRFAGIACKSGMAPKQLDTTEKVFIALQWGAEVGVSPMQSLKNIAVINGRACMWGELLVAIVRRSNVCKSLTHRYEGEGESRVCIVTGERWGREAVETCEGRFGYADAKRAALVGKDTYRQYPDRMYLNRARAFVLKDLFADLLCGLDVAEEAQDIAPERVIEAQIVSGDSAPQNELNALADTMGPAREEIEGPSVLDVDYDAGEASPEELEAMTKGTHPDGELF